MPIVRRIRGSKISHHVAIRTYLKTSQVVVTSAERQKKVKNGKEIKDAEWL